MGLTEIMDSWLNLNFDKPQISQYKYVANIVEDVVTQKIFYLNSNLSRHLVFLFTNSGNPSIQREF